MYHHCVPYKDDQYSGWCYTRLHQNDSGVRTKSGNCDPSCYNHRNKIGKTNYNLASKDHNDLWSENIFLLDSENAGHCHTYNPVNRSHAGSSGQFYSMLGSRLTLFYSQFIFDQHGILNLNLYMLLLKNTVQEEWIKDILMIIQKDMRCISMREISSGQE